MSALAALLENILAVALRLFALRDRIRLVEAGIAHRVSRNGTHRLFEPLEAQEVQAVGTDVLANLLDGFRRSDEFLADARVDAVVAGIADGGELTHM